MVLLRGLRRRCPQCGVGPIFRGWYTVVERCAHCGLDLDTREGDTWAFMYISTAGITGVFVAIMLLVRPPQVWIGQLIVLPLALLLIGGSLPVRKGLAIALDYLSELLWDNHRNRKPRRADPADCKRPKRM